MKQIILRWVVVIFAVSVATMFAGCRVNKVCKCVTDAINGLKHDPNGKPSDVCYEIQEMYEPNELMERMRECPNFNELENYANR